MIKYLSDLRFHYDLLELLARRMHPQLYVGLGIASGECIRRVLPYCGRAIGVDIAQPHHAGEFEFFHGSTAEFGEQLLPALPPIELAFIDADHSFERSLRDFEMLLPHMSSDGLVLMHDTYPENASWLADELCSTSYLTADKIYTASHEYGVEIVTLPTPPGMSLIRRRHGQVAWKQPVT